MAFPSSDEVQSLLSELNEAGQAYNASPDLNGYMARVQIIEKAKKLTRALVAVEMTPNYHGLNVRLVFRLCQLLLIFCDTSFPLCPPSSISVHMLAY